MFASPILLDRAVDDELKVAARDSFALLVAVLPDTGDARAISRPSRSGRPAKPQRARHVQYTYAAPDVRALVLTWSPPTPVASLASR